MVCVYGRVSLYKVMLIKFSEAVMFILCQMQSGSGAEVSEFCTSVNMNPSVDLFPDNGNLWLTIVSII
jgi:hypothetical protein